MNRLVHCVTLVTTFIVFLRGPAPAVADPPARWVLQSSGTTASLRGLSAVTDMVAWASGHGGTCLRTIDGGQTWTDVSPTGYDQADFRDVHGWDAQTAVLMAVGSPAIMLRTSDGGASWKQVFHDDDPDIFLDAMVFWDQRHAMAFGDPIEGHLVIVTSDDAGRNWRRWKPREAITARPNEAGFAASGSCIAVVGAGRIAIGLGGATNLPARVVSWNESAQQWSAVDTHLAGSASAGIFSLAFRDSRHGVAVGGDYQRPQLAAAHIAISHDGGRSWQPPQGDGPRGYRSAVAVVPGSDPPIWVAVGPSGSDYSVDDGQSWQSLSSEGFHTLSFAPAGTGWAAGGDGRIARFQ